MVNIWRNCPSYRLRSSGFIGSVPGDDRAYIADDFFESDVEVIELVDAEKIFQNIYDPTQNALRVKLGNTETAITGKLDPGQIFEIIYDKTYKALRVVSSAKAGVVAHKLDAGQIIKKCFDATTVNLKISE